VNTIFDVLSIIFYIFIFIVVIEFDVLVVFQLWILRSKNLLEFTGMYFVLDILLVHNYDSTHLIAST